MLKKEVSLKIFDMAIISDRVKKDGRSSYVERNREMIDNSDFCVFFYIDKYEVNPTLNRTQNNKSGTRLAFNYAYKKQKIIINVADMLNL